MPRRISRGLTAIDARAMREAIAEFNEKGRAQFLKHYRFSRSSKFYLIFEDRIYDTKVLVAAAYQHATGKVLRHTKFTGGVQTQAVFRRLAQQDSKFVRVFEDTPRSTLPNRYTPGTSANEFSTPVATRSTSLLGIVAMRDDNHQKPNF